ncbi:MAG TPA: hypothetical protein VGA05_08505 [Candidatus Bathyarchaeia archaeon]
MTNARSAFGSIEVSLEGIMYYYDTLPKEVREFLKTCNVKWNPLDIAQALVDIQNALHCSTDWAIKLLLNDLAEQEFEEHQSAITNLGVAPQTFNPRVEKSCVPSPV